ncbi:hypothetical protein EWM64_g9149, partial [Hericium alpestre]
MAAVSGPVAARHPSPFRKAQKISRQPTAHNTASSASSTTDPFHGHEHVARLCARFVSHLFACPETQSVPPALSTSPPTPTPRLDHFIAYALHRTRLHSSVTFAALYLLQRLKARFPAAKGSSGHRLFISAFMIASKIICDDTYSNKSWCIVGQGMFALREINQMEREMCSYLEWQLNVEPTTLRDFEMQVRRDFSGPGPYPPVNLPQSVPAPFPHPNASSSTSIPMFGSSRTSPPKPSAPSISPNSSITYSMATSLPIPPPHRARHPRRPRRRPRPRRHPTPSRTMTSSRASLDTLQQDREAADARGHRLEISRRAEPPKTVEGRGATSSHSPHGLS